MNKYEMVKTSSELARVVTKITYEWCRENKHEELSIPITGLMLACHAIIEACAPGHIMSKHTKNIAMKIADEWEDK